MDLEPLSSKVMDLQEAMSQFPQVELETKHYFAEGMYCRWLYRPIGTTIVGKIHKKEHFYIIAKGKVAVSDGDQTKIYEAGDVIVSRPGTKRAVHALEDSICLTVHRTNKHNLDKIEKELIIPERGALFDARNKLKVLK